MKFNTLIALCLFSLFWSTSASFAASICDQNSAKQEQLQSLYNPGYILANLPQVSNQWRVTTCGFTSFHPWREACWRKDIYGEANGRFGSCATYSGFTTAIAIARSLGIALPTAYQYRTENIVRIYDNYGNAWDKEHPGLGNFLFILNKILTEMASDSNLDSKRYLLANYAQKFITIKNEPGRSVLQEKIAAAFNAQSRQMILPTELILDGWVLDRPSIEYCSHRNEKNECDEKAGSDHREAHSALIVGRKMVKGSCYVQVRNSWMGACNRRGYGRSGRECDRYTDSLWIEESELLKGVFAARIFSSAY